MLGDFWSWVWAAEREGEGYLKARNLEAVLLLLWLVAVAVAPVSFRPGIWRRRENWGTGANNNLLNLTELK